MWPGDHDHYLNCHEESLGSRWLKKVMGLFGVWSCPVFFPFIFCHSLSASNFGTFLLSQVYFDCPLYRRKCSKHLSGYSGIVSCVESVHGVLMSETPLYRSLTVGNHMTQ